MYNFVDRTHILWVKSFKDKLICNNSVQITNIQIPNYMIIWCACHVHPYSPLKTRLNSSDSKPRRVHYEYLGGNELKCWRTVVEVVIETVFEGTFKEWYQRFLHQLEILRIGMYEATIMWVSSLLRLLQNTYNYFL